MPGYVIGLILLSAATAVFLLLLWNALEMAPSSHRRPPLRRRVLVALLGAPAALLAVAFVLLARND